METLPNKDMQEQPQKLASMWTEDTGVPVKERRALPHMELIKGKWEEALPVDSPSMQVSLRLHKPSYRQMGMIPPLPKSPSLGMMVVADTGAQMCILPKNKVVCLGMKLFKVSTRVMGATLESQLDVRGGAFLEVSNPSGTHSTRTVQMFYVA